MDWPRTPVEHRPAFRPPFCPRKECPDHQRREPGYRCHAHASYDTARRRDIPRYRCCRCRKTFSRQAFSVTYYRKRPELLRPVAAGLVAGSALRQLARSLGCAPSTVAGIAAHLGRHAILLHHRSLEQLRQQVDESLVFDHFETFEFTQDYPFGIGTAVGARSWFVYTFDPAPHGRGGRLSQRQTRRLRSRPKRALAGRYRGSTRRVLAELLKLPKPGHTLRIAWDGHPDYERARRELRFDKRLHVDRHPNPPRGPKGTPRSSEARARDEAMFPVDLLHKLYRHSLAHHRRETIAFARRINAALERFALAAVWRNFVKRKSERRTHSPTPAMELGLTDGPWSWKQVLSRRLFFHRCRLPEPWPSLYRRLWATPLLERNAVHDRLRAF